MRFCPWRFVVTASCMLAMTLLSVTFAPAEDGEEGFKSLFDGKSLTGWDGNPKFWSVKEGAIVGQTTKENPTKGNTFLIWKQGDVDDFELRLSFRIVGGNSGIQYRSKVVVPEDWVVGGYQADFEAGETYSGILYEERGRGILAQRGQKTTIDQAGKVQVTGQVGDTKEIQAAIKKEDWNDYTVIAQGNHLIHKINGKTTVDVTDEHAAKRAMSGILALQLHAGPPMTVQFKNIRMKRLKLADRKKIVLVAGRPSHGKMEHEFNAGVWLLRKCLDKVAGVQPAEYHNGWPADPTAFDNADAILFYMDGGGGHPAIQGDRLKQLDALAKKGVGIACAHYAVEVPKDKGGPEFLSWIGGYYETGYSINPHWEADVKMLPDHPISRGVRPFKIKDEWYYNIRFRSDRVLPIVKATPPDGTRATKAAKEFPGREEVLAWVSEQPGAGRGFGFTGGHFHVNWGNEDFRKLVLNALLWTAGAEIPADGVASTLSADDLKQNLDKK